MIEETEEKDAGGVTQKAQLRPFGVELLRWLKDRGYPLGIVADTRIGTYRNVLKQHGVFELFDVFAISEEVGCQKPDRRIFDKALSGLDIGVGERHRVLMVGNNLKRDIKGANRRGLFSVWTHWNDRYPDQPETEDEKPDRTIGPLRELIQLIEELEDLLNGRRGTGNLDLAYDLAPVIMFDSREPFLPVMAGCTVADQALPSPSFPRILHPPKNGRIVEYAIYWDWDIGHHYELEHLWVVVNENGEAQVVEGSAHGKYYRLLPDPPSRERVEDLIKEGTRYSLNENSENIGIELGFGKEQPVVYSQPGKHAFAPDPAWFKPREEFVRPCLGEAGSGGVLIKDLFVSDLKRQDFWNEVSREYLRKKAFEPTFDFSRRCEAGKDFPLVSWPELFREIPVRIEAWMEALVSGEEKPITI